MFSLLGSPVQPGAGEQVPVEAEKPVAVLGQRFEKRSSKGVHCGAWYLEMLAESSGNWGVAG